MRGSYKAFKPNLNRLIKNIAGIGLKSKIIKAWNFDENDFYEYQKKELIKTIQYAIKYTEFYKRKEYQKLDINESMQLQDILNRIPILKKDSVKLNNKSFWSTEPLKLKTYHTTSGTSGTPLKIPGTLKERSFTNQNLNYWYKYINGKKKQRFLALSGFMVPDNGELYWLDPISKNAYLSIYDIKPENIEEIINLINEIQPTIIYGYASALNQLADVIGSKNLLKTNLNLISTSETLALNWKRNIESNIGEVFNLYGSQEGAHMVLECKEHNLHINPLVGIVEILDENDNPVKHNELGRVVISSLFKKSMPLIRYEIGDMAYGCDTSKKCSCGLNWPMIGEVQGRKEDLVRKRDGSNIPLLSFHALKDVDLVREGQLIQYDYEDFEFNIVFKEEPNNEAIKEVEAHIINQLKSRLNLSSLNISFNYKKEIEKGSNGKFKSVEVKF